MAYEPELEKLERRYQDDPARNFAQLAERYRKDGRLEDALTLLRGHLAERPNYVSGLVVLGRCLLDQQADGEARETFERVLAVDAEHIIALRALGEIAERAGDPVGAKSWFTRLLDVDPMNDEAQAALERVATMEAAPPPPPPAAEAAPPEEPVEPVAPVGTAEPDVVGFAPTSFGAHERPETVPEPVEVEKVEEAAAFADVGEQPSVDEQPSEEEVEAAGWEVEKQTDDFLPRVAQPPPMDIEQYSEIEISSLLPDEAPLIGGGRERQEEEPYQLPTGVQEVDLGFTESAAEAEVAETEEAPAGEELALEPFDNSLGWGAGERVSRQVSQDDIAEAEHAHQEGLDEVFHQLPGLESAEAAGVADVSSAEAVEGLQAYEPPKEEIEPVEGLEPTHPETAPEEETAGAPELVVEEPAPTGVAETEGFYLPPEDDAAAEEEASAGIESANSEGARPTIERAAAPAGLPDLGQPEEPETPLVLDAEPEPVVTETMAELYVRQGLVNEAREVYHQLLAQRPDDPALTEKLADLEREIVGAHGRRTGTFSAVATGGQSARAFLGAILSAQPAVVVAPVEAAPAPADSAATVQTAAVEVAEPAGPGPMDEAFGDDDSESDVEGAPTQPAEDEVSLSTVFGDETPTPTTAPSPAPEPPQAPKSRAPGGFSFDEFFGKAASGGGDAPRRDSITDDEGDEAFKDWLKGLRA